MSETLDAASIAGTSVLEVSGLKTEFHLRNVDGLRGRRCLVLGQRRGECVGLVGESGCGKSTTGLSVMKLLPEVGHITGGSVRLNGPRSRRPRRERDAARPRQRDRDDLPGPDDLAQPDLDDRCARSRSRSASTAALRKKEARDRAVEVLNSSGCPGRRSASTTTRTSSRAGCASA